MSIYRESRGWNGLDEIASLPRPPAQALVPEAAKPATPDWSSVRKATPADFMLPLSERWFDGLPPSRAPCALATSYPRIINLIAAQWSDQHDFPLLLEDLLGDRRGGRMGFPSTVQNELIRLQEYWYNSTLTL